MDRNINKFKFNINLTKNYFSLLGQNENLLVEQQKFPCSNYKDFYIYILILFLEGEGKKIPI